MKKALTFLSMIVLASVLVSFFVQQPDLPADIYLRRSPIVHGTTGTNNDLSIDFCCGSMGPNNFRINCDSPYVYPQRPGNAMYVEEYMYAELVDPNCPSIVYELGDKEYLYPQCGNPFPYAKNTQTGNPVRVATQEEFDSLNRWDPGLHHVDSFAMINNPPMQNTDPYLDCSIGVGMGCTDCYNDVHFDYTAVPAGTYWLHCGFTLPPNNIDPGVFPNDYWHLCEIRPDRTFAWTSQMPAAAIPPMPTQITILQNGANDFTVTWSGLAHHWEVDMMKMKGQYCNNPVPPYEGKKMGNTITTQVNALNHLSFPTGGCWSVRIRACNCSGGCSTFVWSVPVQR